MNITEMSSVIVGLDREEREVFLLCLADEVTDEEKASWLRARARNLDVVGSGRRRHWWIAPKEKSRWDSCPNHIPWGIGSCLQGHRSQHNEFSFPAVYYSSREEAWEDLFRVVFEEKDNVV